MWGEKDSNLDFKEQSKYDPSPRIADLLRQGFGDQCGERRIRTFEVETTDLQSVPFGHSGISPPITKNL